MKKNKKIEPEIPRNSGATPPSWETHREYLTIPIDVLHEPTLVLSTHLRVLAANESFCHMFQIDYAHTVDTLVYELGNGQWNIPGLHTLLEEILPQNTFFRNFEIIHEFPSVGRKVLLCNARHITFQATGSIPQFPAVILFTIEDMTDMMIIAETLASHTRHPDAQLAERTALLEMHTGALEAELHEMKKKHCKPL